MHLFMPYNIVSYSQFDWGGFPLISNNQLHNIWQQSKGVSTNLPIGEGSVSCAMWKEQHVIAQFIVFPTLFFYSYSRLSPYVACKWKYWAYFITVSTVYFFCFCFYQCFYAKVIKILEWYFSFFLIFCSQVVLSEMSAQEHEIW